MSAISANDFASKLCEAFTTIYSVLLHNNGKYYNEEFHIKSLEASTMSQGEQHLIMLLFCNEFKKLIAWFEKSARDTGFRCKRKLGYSTECTFYQIKVQ